MGNQWYINKIWHTIIWKGSFVLKYTQSSERMNCSIWLIDVTLTGITNPGQSRPESNGNYKVIYIPLTLTLERTIIKCLIRDTNEFQLLLSVTNNSIQL